MSRSGNLWDNAAVENFFSSLKTERSARRSTGRGTTPLTLGEGQTWPSYEPLELGA
jgi:transposase InsO family protein